MTALKQLNPNAFVEAIQLTDWRGRAKEAYDAQGKPNFLNSLGQLIEGIYLNMPNDVYRSLPAVSSSEMKMFVESPAIYARHYLSDINRKRTRAQKRTLDAGTYGHELCLEPEGFYTRYFRDLVPADFPDALHSVAEIETALIKAGLSVNETKDDKIARLVRANQNVDVTTLKTIRDIDAELEKCGLNKTESKLDKGNRLLSVVPTAQVFDVLFMANRAKHGAPKTIKIQGEECTTYGDKLPIDGIVWDDAHRVQQTVRSHSQANAELQNGLPEVAIIARCPLTQMMLKAKFDWLRFDGAAADVKTTRDTKPEKFKSQMKELKYPTQQAFYCYVAELAQVIVERFVFIAVEYLNADICQPYELPDLSARKARSELMNALKEFQKCKETNNWYGWSEKDCTIVLDL